MPVSFLQKTFVVRRRVSRSQPGAKNIKAPLGADDYLGQQSGAALNEWLKREYPHQEPNGELDHERPADLIEDAERAVASADQSEDTAQMPGRR